MPRYYFVDEAGDSTLFSRRGNTLIGSSGCSRYFIVGLLITKNAAALEKDLGELRGRILQDPYFLNIPSLQASSKKTALQFHAKDDLPEIRRDVFAMLRKHDLGFHAVIRDKNKVLDYVRQENERDSEYRYNQNELYDSLVRRLFEGVLRTEDAHIVTFAARGTSNRTRALAKAMQIDLLSTSSNDRSVEVRSSRPYLALALQAVDYYLWALQRLYERGEDRYWNYVAPHAKLIMDLDDTRRFASGARYTQKEPLTIAALGKSVGDIGSSD